jgi:hypothetical protein
VWAFQPGKNVDSTLGEVVETGVRDRQGLTGRPNDDGSGDDSLAIHHRPGVIGPQLCRR